MPNTKSARMKGLTTHRSQQYGIMGGLANSRHQITRNNTRATSRLIIPSGAKAGLQYMQMHNLLSKNPLSGGVGKIVKSKPCNCRPGPSGLAHGPSGLAHGPSGLAHGPSGLAHGPSGLAHGPSGLAHGPSGLTTDPCIPGVCGCSKADPCPVEPSGVAYGPSDIGRDDSMHIHASTTWTGDISLNVYGGSTCDTVPDHVANIISIISDTSHSACVTQKVSSNINFSSMDNYYTKWMCNNDSELISQTYQDPACTKGPGDLRTYSLEQSITEAGTCLISENAVFFKPQINNVKYNEALPYCIRGDIKYKCDYSSHKCTTGRSSDYTLPTQTACNKECAQPPKTYSCNNVTGSCDICANSSQILSECSKSCTQTQDNRVLWDKDISSRDAPILSNNGQTLYIISHNLMIYALNTSNGDTAWSKQIINPGSSDTYIINMVLTPDDKYLFILINNSSSNTSFVFRYNTSTGSSIEPQDVNSIFPGDIKNPAAITPSHDSKHIIIWSNSTLNVLYTDINFSNIYIITNKTTSTRIKTRVPPVFTLNDKYVIIASYTDSNTTNGPIIKFDVANTDCSYTDIELTSLSPIIIDSTNIFIGTLESNVYSFNIDDLTLDTSYNKNISHSFCAEIVQDSSNLYIVHLHDKTFNPLDFSDPMFTYQFNAFSNFIIGGSINVESIRKKNLTSNWNKDLTTISINKPTIVDDSLFILDVNNILHTFNMMTGVVKDTPVDAINVMRQQYSHTPYVFPNNMNYISGGIYIDKKLDPAFKAYEIHSLDYNPTLLYTIKNEYRIIPYVLFSKDYTTAFIMDNINNNADSSLPAPTDKSIHAITLGQCPAGTIMNKYLCCGGSSNSSGCTDNNVCISEPSPAIDNPNFPECLHNKQKCKQ